MYPALTDGTVPDSSNSVGYRAVAVPGALAGESLMLSKFGTISLKEAMEPAIRHAENGFEVSRTLNEVMVRAAEKLKRFPPSAEILLRGSKPYSVGERITLKDLARTFRRISDEGISVFYEGEIGQAILRDIQDNGGLLTEKDLAAYEPMVLKPLHSKYRGYDVFTSPPPFGGVAVLEVLHILEQFNVSGMGHNAVETLRLLSDAMTFAYADKMKYLSDPRIVGVPTSSLLSRKRAEMISRKILSDKPNEKVSESPHGDSTTHLTVADDQGNVVAMTETIECYFGSGIIVPGTGILLNDEMHDFDPRPRHANSVSAGKRPASNQSPTVVSKNGKFVLGLGSAGGTRIVSAVTQVISNVIDHRLDVSAALAAPRIHHEEGTVHIEGGIPTDVEAAIRATGKKVNFRKEFDIYFGGVHAVAGGRSREGFSGAADPRRDGTARGF
jgi:gamma-glutamyltranspeptidase/glutathione hydrolase